jgi:hypothetical protein
MKEGNFFFSFLLSPWDLLNDVESSFAFGSFGKLSMNSSALIWFETIWNYGVEAIDHWTIFWMRFK